MLLESIICVSLRKTEQHRYTELKKFFGKQKLFIKHNFNIGKRRLTSKNFSIDGFCQETNVTRYLNIWDVFSMDASVVIPGEK